ncbi:hypothetical protein PV382_23875 [Streptomyces scabiei]|uniref:hypothetical protein n=1 Tax=Streptomyces scabiei TaxID=1930 RepID=UPI0029A8A324|nr:hypothetical protein [Streptomyces scabiei]MDX2658326.1 hypothetical protein [Streptomyces scabiei]MDX2870483.1 hypothetical protein [Streptomyces scabiei]MDX3175292.1 hypothetical protein [Streptomyces scabiei]
MSDQATSARWQLTIQCPRPRNRAVDDFHVRPERVADTVAMFLGPRAELLLTARTVRLCYTSATPLTDIGYWQKQLAFVLDCLYLDVPRDARRELRLPRPVRTELREMDAQDFPADENGLGQTAPSEGGRVT